MMASGPYNKGSISLGKVNMKVIKGRNIKYLFSPHLAGKGISWTDTRINKEYDLATCQTSRGRMLITWGLNHGEEDFIPGVNYVYVGDCYDSRTGKTRCNHEAIITALR